MTDAPFRVVRVDIHGQQYAIRSRLDARYVSDLARYVDQKIQAAAEMTPTGDSLRLAILAAINLADELFHAREAQHHDDGQLTERTLELERLIDQALAS